mmetsp:Transcript_39027/g.98360  ORF Transcript_39027/g.98360 Transcript_39027/m.98360 type:complete len:338 (+) Transcript_39027:68-1081(+)|eukprot:CAMPEP_0174242532 /NCGR_PEP_ID=MMETSP0417-20130205/28267_1 /TAXON_ID=242541 /ORGANISM="Mayorella sp, Strain BSH-02190019" /LENGTH=337 /DNA_ID=CAMNT_0015321943 /DNA_START=6 /DNA_END=1019 /DNA_ORIENTATION=-
MTSIFVYQLGGFAFLIALFKFCEKTSAMRGMEGEPLPALLQRLLRLIYLVILLAPLIFYAPYVFIPLLILYLPSYLDLSEIQGGRPSPSVRSWRCWYWVKSYFNLKLRRTVELDPSHQYLFCFHPHAILPFGGFINSSSEVNQWTELFPGIEARALAASFAFYIPIYREIILGGGFCDAARYSARRIIEQGHSLMLVPGGATEALYASPKEDILVLRKRRGFVRLALKHGLALVPCFSFNENNSYELVDSKWAFVEWLKTRFQRVFGISLPIIAHLIPHKCNITTVVGEPMFMEKIEHPDHETIDKYLQEYMDRVTALYAKHGQELNEPNDKKLSII